MTCGCGEQKNWCVKAGATFRPTIRWAQQTLTAAAITAITQATPVEITAPSHGLPNGWPAAVVGVTGMPFINASDYPPRTPDLHMGTVVDSNTVQLNDVSSALWPAYISGGSLVYYTPQALSGVTFALSIYATPEFEGATPLVILSNGSGGTGLTVDGTNMLILPVLQTGALPTGWPSDGVAYYQLTATDSSDNVTELMFGTITVE